MYIFTRAEFKIGTQQDSQEVMRFLLQKLRAEEIQVGAVIYLRYVYHICTLIACICTHYYVV